MFTLGSACLRLNVGSGPLHQQWKVKVYKKLTTKKVMSSWWGEPQLYDEDSPRRKILCLPSWRPSATSSMRCRRVRWPVKRHLFMRPAFPCAGWACYRCCWDCFTRVVVIYSGIVKTRWWFQRFFMFSPTWGRFPIWLVFFRLVEATNQSSFVRLLPPAFFSGTVHQIDLEEHRE